MDTATTSAIAAASTQDVVTQPAATEVYLSATPEHAWTSSDVHEVTGMKGQDEMASKSWHFKYWCPYCELSYCCPVEKYVCAKIQRCKLIYVKHPQQHDAFRMIREPHPGTYKCYVMRYSEDGTKDVMSYSDSDSD